MRPHAGLARYALAMAALVFVASESQADVTWTRDSFWIFGHAIEVPSDTNRYELIDDAGIDFLIHGGNVSYDSTTLIARILDNLADANFDLQVMAQYATPQGLFDVVPYKSRNAFCMQVEFDSLFNNHPDLRLPSVAGYVVWDEPCERECHDDITILCQETAKLNSCWPHLEAVTTTVRTHDSTSTKLPYVNLLPIYSACIDDEFPGDLITRYRAYLDEYLDYYNDRSVTAPLLSMDHYPFWGYTDSTFASFKHFNIGLKIQAERAARSSTEDERVPMWTLIQLSKYIDAGVYEDNPDFEQTRWQAYNALAYGAKGIGYWTLSHRDLASSSYDAFAQGIIDTNGGKTAIYDSVKTLNTHIRSLGDTLMRLDPVAVYHQGAGRMIKIDDFVLANSKDYYNIVTSITQADGDTSGMVGHFKHRYTGEDYVLVVNKDWDDPHDFTVNLGNQATTVERLSKSNGAGSTDTTNASSFNVISLAPGDGELFRIVDDVDEHIPDANVIVKVGTRTYYGTESGTILIDEANGFRAHARDGTLNTPIRHLEVHDDRVYVLQKSATAGTIRVYDADLTSRVPLGPNGANPVAFTVVPGPSSDRVFVAYGDSSSIGVWDEVANPTSDYYTYVDSLAKGFTVNDLEYQASFDALIVAHDDGIARFDNGTGFDELGRWTDDDEIVDVALGDDGRLYAARDDGSNGLIYKIEVELDSTVATWDDFGDSSRVTDIVSNTETLQIMAVTIDGSTEHFKLLGMCDLVVQDSVSATDPRTSLIQDDGIGVLAEDAGVTYEDIPDGTTPPDYTIDDLTAPTTAKFCVMLAWDAPGNGGDPAADRYDVRYSTSNIASEADFALATEVDGEPTPGSPGTDETLVVDNLSSCTTYYFAIKARDGCAWASFDVASATTDCAGASCIVGEDALTELEFTGPLTLDPFKPNPIRNNATLSFMIPTVLRGQKLDISAFDVAGRRVARISRGQADHGPQTMQWDLRMSNGKKVRAGMYFVRLRVGEQSQARSILVIP